MRSPIGNGERGYALLAVFLMAALVAMFLYAQLPRVAFESERDKEQALIDRGEQYKRAIQLYVAALKKYPQKIEDLENTNNKRYLRRKYIDPFTGKDEWRLIHVNAAGVLTDSLVTKPPTADGKDGSLAGASGALGATGTTGATGPEEVNAAVKRRPSDLVGNAYTQPVDADPNNPATWAPITIAGPSGTANGQPPSGAVGFNQNGTPLQGQGFTGSPGLPNALPNGVPPQQNTGAFPLPGQPGFNPTQNQFKVDANGQLVPITPPQPGQAVAFQNGAPAGTPGFSAPGMNPTGNTQATPNVATTAIQNQLMNPNPVAGANGLGTSAGMQTGGIAGVASTYKGPSIKVYATRQKYQEWEFIFSLNNQQGAPKQGNPLGPSGAAGASGAAGPGFNAPAGSTLGSGAGSTTGNP